MQSTSDRAVTSRHPAGAMTATNAGGLGLLVVVIVILRLVILLGWRDGGTAKG